MRRLRNNYVGECGPMSSELNQLNCRWGFQFGLDGSMPKINNTNNAHLHSIAPLYVLHVYSIHTDCNRASINIDSLKCITNVVLINLHQTYISVYKSY